MILLTACTSPAPESADEPPRPAADIHSVARPTEIAVSHLDLDLSVDFEKRVLTGRASLTLDRRAPADAVFLDTRDLEILSVTLDDGTEPNFELGEDRPFLGRGLRVEVTPETRVVHVDYRSSPDAAALLWLDPAQSAGGEHPFLFTQSQAVLARTWVPCQDTPGVRMTYEATVRVPPRLLAVMSAENPTERSADGVYRFSMPQAIPSYLLALAVGDLEFRAMSERTGVYAEPSMVDRAAWEFAETEQMMVAVEALYGPYRWGRYDILVLPPSFPFGGMENPRLTFATPTILAGDRSLVALIAHELAHSWSGNLVTNATWNDFWLNEGFTVYLERRIMESIHGHDYAEMLALLGRQDLDKTLDDLGDGHRDGHLLLDLEGRDPDDGMSDVAYEKGYFFLRAIEEAVGREPFDVFLRDWFDSNAFRSATTSEFLAYLGEHLIKGDEDLRQRLAIDRWIEGPGMPAGTPAVESAAFAAVDAQIAGFAAGETSAADLATDGWSTHEWLHFLRGLPEDMSRQQMAELDARFELSATGNSEKLHEWLHHVLANRYEPGYAALDGFLTSMGRRKFLKPLYQRMAGEDDLKPMALDIYRRARPSYHPVSVATIDEILGWDS
ncbi:MAG: M1 family metallopeptidase [bacterium]|nr:M1 family metallopeptidase [bacterium]